MKPLSCRISQLVTVPLDENDPEERELMAETDFRTKEIGVWGDGFLIEVQPVTKKFISGDYQNEQTSFFGIVWDASDGTLKAISLSEIRIEEKEINRLIHKEWS